MSRTPVGIGIAGDSGCGKDSLVAMLIRLFGDKSIVSISGDDYHSFERKSPMWKILTHLDPRANDLKTFSNHFLSLLAGKVIFCRHYDHKKGLFTIKEPKKASDIILLSGLHSFYLENLRENLDLKIFLSMDENLRRFFKIRRDVKERGHPYDKVIASIERRVDDCNKYILPQKKYADIVFSLVPKNPELLSDYNYQGKIACNLHVSLKHEHLVNDLYKMLLVFSISSIDIEVNENEGVSLIIDEEGVRAEDIKEIYNKISTYIKDFLDIEAKWLDGVNGLMQLITLLYLEEIVKNRVYQ